jgi:hypothetical protein
MLLSIDQKKIDELLVNNPPLYTVTPSTLETVDVSALNYEIPSGSVYSTVTEMSPEAERYRDRVLSLRQHIIDRGEHPASSTEELERIIDEMRGR